MGWQPSGGSTGGPPTGAAGGVLSGTYPNPALVAVAGHLANDVNLAVSTTTTILDTASLAVGVWLVRFGITMQGATGPVNIPFNMIDGTATATFEGQTACQFLLPGAVSQDVSCDIEAIVTVTVAGTIRLQGVNPSATLVPTAKALTTLSSFAKATGYTALRVA